LFVAHTNCESYETKSNFESDSEKAGREKKGRERADGIESKSKLTKLVHWLSVPEGENGGEGGNLVLGGDLLKFFGVD